MRIHVSDKVTIDTIMDAADKARVYFAEDGGFSEHKSKTHDHAFEVHLTGDSKRRPNRYSGGDDYAATWDQWGVFLQVIFDADPNARCGSAKHPVYANRGDYYYKTDWRFMDRQDEVAYATEPVYWPADAHGDHTFRYAGVPYENACTKCSAVKRWGQDAIMDRAVGY